MDSDRFHQALLAWYDRHGRKDLPWKRGRDPYRIWVSEIMLQQTQVQTVLPYYERFIACFPTVVALARSPLDDVLAHWAGLGYYARARNLHRAASLVCARHGGVIPCDPTALQALPGIGRSTAGAILAMAFDARHPILDGNAKRVLARFHGVAGWPGEKRVADRLWALADEHTPAVRVADYTQAIMDLGAAVCVRRRPVCAACPVVEGCVARREARAHDLPAPRPRRELPVRQTILLILQNDHDEVLLERRPPNGIWGGLWSLPECPADAPVAQWCVQHLGYRVDALAPWPAFRHTFSHFHLDVTPIHGRVGAMIDWIADGGTLRWLAIDAAASGGMAAPIRRLIDALKTSGDPNGTHGLLREVGQRG